MNDTMFYSATTNSFYPLSMFDSYRSSGTLPDDIVEVSESVYIEFSANHSEKRREPDSDGMPSWVPLAVNHKETARELIRYATSIISPLTDERDAGIISDEDLSRWKAWVAYRKAVRETDVSKDKIEWPKQPE